MLNGKNFELHCQAFCESGSYSLFTAPIANQWISYFASLLTMVEMNVNFRCAGPGHHARTSSQQLTLPHA